MVTSVRPTAEATTTPPLLEGLAAADVGGPDWLRARRADALAALRDRGLPGKRDEAWRFTSVRAVTTPRYAPAAREAADEAQALVEARLGAPDDAPRVLVVNGRLTGVAPLPEGVRALPLAAALDEASLDVEAVLGRLAPAEHFAALNAARFEDGLVLALDAPLPPGTTLHLVHVSTSGATPVVSYPRQVVLVGPGVEAVLLETFLHDGRGVALSNAVTEVRLAPAARLEHVRVTEGSAEGRRVDTLSVRVERGARYAARLVTLGGGFHRTDLHVELAGEGAETELDGVYHATTGDLVDHHVRVDHRVPHGTSRQVFRGLVDGTGHAVFDTIARVHPDAQKAEAHQENRNLLLSDGASLHTKPHLEIEADDVKASHGATVGSLDEGQVFYLRSRGVGREEAEAVLTYGFVGELIDRVPHAPTRARLMRALLARLPYGEGVVSLLEDGALRDEARP